MSTLDKIIKHIPKWIPISLLVILICFILLVVLSRALGLVHSGEYLSPNIKTSKENGAFIAEYRTPSNPYKINDTIILTVKEVWLEQDCWFDAKSREVTVLYEGYKLLLNVEENHPYQMNASWHMVTKDNRYLSGMNGIPLVQSYDTPPSDTLEFNVINDGSHAILGKFVLIKKK